MTSPQVSVIMPAYNSGRYIKDSILSIQTQTYQDWELIVIDDCSTDNTSEIVKNLIREDPRIQLLSTEKNSGSGVARNIGIEAAKGRFIAFCDSDDRWYPDKLEIQIPFMINNGYEFTNGYYADVDSNFNVLYIVRPPEKQDFNDMIKGCNVGSNSVVYDTRRIGKMYMPPFRRSEDWGLWLRILKKVDYLHLCPHILYQYQHHKGGVSRNRIAMVRAAIQVYHEELGYSYLKSYWIFMTQFMPRQIHKKLKKVIHRE